MDRINASTGSLSATVAALVGSATFNAALIIVITIAGCSVANDYRCLSEAIVQNCSYLWKKSAILSAGSLLLVISRRCKVIFRWCYLQVLFVFKKRAPAAAGYN
jgi:hypothetical protein